jgi:hypothetical protein
LVQEHYKIQCCCFRSWYEYQVKNVTNESAFEANKEFELGKEAPWTTEDILVMGEVGENTIPF